MLRRLAHSLANNDLDACIGEQKTFNEASKKLLEADMKGHEYRYKWSQSEKNPVFKDVFERDLQIAHIRFDAFQKFIAKMRESRQHFKAIAKEERKIEEVRKHHANICTRLARLKKQVDSASKKNDISKIENLLPELQSALAINDHATLQLEEEVERTEIFKVRCVRDALRLEAEAYQLLGRFMTHLSISQQSLASLIPDDPPNIAGYDSYKDGPQMSSSIMDDLCHSLSIQPPTAGRLGSFIIVDVSDGDSTTSSIVSTATAAASSPPDSPYSRFVIPAPTARPPILPPRPSKTEYLALNEQASLPAMAAAATATYGGYLDDTTTDYVASEDVEAERRRAKQNVAAIAHGKPPLAPKPKLEKPEPGLHGEPFPGQVPPILHYTLPRGEADGSSTAASLADWSEDTSTRPLRGGSTQQHPAVQHFPPTTSPGKSSPVSRPPKTGTTQPSTAKVNITASPPTSSPSSAAGATAAVTTSLEQSAVDDQAPNSAPVPLTKGAVQQSEATSTYQDPVDAYLWLWPKGKGEFTTSNPNVTGSAAPVVDANGYQKPWECVSKEEGLAQKRKSQCMPPNAAGSAAALVDANGYQKPRECFSKEEGDQRRKSQCMPRRRSVHRSSSRSPPQVTGETRRSRSLATDTSSTAQESPSPPDRQASISPDSATKDVSALQSTLHRMDISLDRSEKLQAAISSHSDQGSELTDATPQYVNIDPDAASGDEMEYAVVPIAAHFQHMTASHVDGGAEEGASDWSIRDDTASSRVPVPIRHRLSALSHGGASGTPGNGTPAASPVVLRKRSLPLQVDGTRAARVLEQEVQVPAVPSAQQAVN
eukprot:scpid12135/ scgid4800/ 